MEKQNILCIGGDARTIYMCSFLAQDHRVYAYGTKTAPIDTVMLDELSDMPVKADVLVLPMLNGACCDDGHISISCNDKAVYAEDLIPMLDKKSVVTGGLADDRIISFFRENGYELQDYFKRRELIIKNFIPTAEGALNIVMKERDETVFGSKVLITGYGNVSKAAAKLFSACGAYVTCAVRRTDAAAEAETNGLCSADITRIREYISDYDIIINSVPALIIDKAVISCVRKDSLIVDLASRPGGVDLSFAEKAGIRCIHALALPGKAAPKTAGRYLAETVENIISERRE